MMQFLAKSGDQMRQTREYRVPFIGPKEPFVGPPYPIVGPFIGQNLPSVPNRTSSGFTLVELITALVIAGILVSLAVPSMTSFIKNNRLTSQANELMAGLSFTRSEAIKRGVNITICRSSDSATCDPAAGSWATGWIVVDGAGQVLRVHEALSGGNTLTGTGGVNGLADQLVYGSTGMAVNFVGPAQFQLCDDRGATSGKALQVAVTGRARIETAPPAGC